MNRKLIGNVVMGIGIILLLVIAADIYLTKMEMDVVSKIIRLLVPLIIMLIGAKIYGDEVKEEREREEEEEW